MMGGMMMGSASSMTGMQSSSAQVQARDSKRINNITQLHTALMVYKQDHGKYPASLSDASNYMYKIPTDPSTHQPYSYTVLNNGASYCLATELEESSYESADKRDADCYSGPDIAPNRDGIIYSVQP